MKSQTAMQASPNNVSVMQFTDEKIFSAIIPTPGN